MVWIVAPVHQAPGLPVGGLVFAAPPSDLLSEATQEAVRRYERTALPEYELWRPAAPSSRIFWDLCGDEIAPIATEDSAGPLVRVSKPQSARVLAEIAALTSQKPMRQDAHLSFAQMCGLETGLRRRYSCRDTLSCPLLAEPLLSVDPIVQPTRLAAAMATELGIAELPVPDQEHVNPSSMLLFRPGPVALSPALPQAGALLQVLGHRPAPLTTFSSIPEPIIAAETTINACQTTVWKLGAEDLSLELLPEALPPGLTLVALTKPDLTSELSWKPVAALDVSLDGVVQRQNRIPAAIAAAEVAVPPVPLYPSLIQNYGNNAANCEENVFFGALQPLEVPLLPEALAAAAPPPPLHPLAAFPALFEAPTGATDADLELNVPKDAYALEKCSLLWEMLALELASDGESLLLPVATPAASAAATLAYALAQNPTAEVAAVVLIKGLAAGVVAECGAGKLSTHSTELHLDWSLSTTQTSLRTTELLSACQRATAALQPAPITALPPQPPAVTGLAERSGGPHLLSLLLQPFDPSGGPTPSRSSSLLCSSAAAAATSPAGPAALNDAALTRAAGSKHSFDTPTDDGAAAAPPEKRARREGAGLGGGGGLGFFMKLHRDVGGPSAAPMAMHGAEREVNGVQSRRSSGITSSSGLSDFLPAAGSLKRVAVGLSAEHMALLRVLRDTDALLVATLPSDIAAEPFPELGGLAAAVRGAARGAAALQRALAGAAVLRQAAQLLIHHGIRPASMYLDVSTAELPAAAEAVGPAARALAAAAARVEADSTNMLDHPKHVALRADLATVSALSTESKILVIGDPRTFFTLYGVVQSVGLRACHLDREGEIQGLLAAGEPHAGEGALAAAAQQACEVADCVLAATSLVLNGLNNHQNQENDRFDFLNGCFRHVVVYESTPATQAAVLQALGVSDGEVGGGECVDAVMPCPCSVTALEVSPVDLEPPPPLPVAAPLPLNAPAPAPAAPAPPPPTLDWPLVVSSSLSRPVRSRRDLRERLLALERVGAVVVERPLQHLDLVLSPSAALSIFTDPENNPSPEFAPLAAAVAALAARAGRAFKKLFIVCEGGLGFRAQVACGIPDLVAEAARCGLALQVDITADAAGTAAAVAAVAEAHLDAWRRQDAAKGLQYEVGDPLSEIEAFLAGFPCLNPHSAAVLAAAGLPLQQLLRLDALPANNLPAAIHLVPKHSLELFVEAYTGGAAVAAGGGGAASAAPAAAFPQPQPWEPNPPAPAQFVPQQQQPQRPAPPPQAPVLPPPPLPPPSPPAFRDALFATEPAGFPADLCLDAEMDAGPNAEGSMGSAPAPSWCGPPLGTAAAHQRGTAAAARGAFPPFYHPPHPQHAPPVAMEADYGGFVFGGGGHGAAPTRQFQQQPYYHPGVSMQHNGGPEVDEFGVEVDPVSHWEEGGGGVGGGGRGGAFGYEQEALSGYKPMTYNHQNHMMDVDPGVGTSAAYDRRFFAAAVPGAHGAHGAQQHGHLPWQPQVQAPHGMMYAQIHGSGAAQPFFPGSGGQQQQQQQQWRGGGGTAAAVVPPAFYQPHPLQGYYPHQNHADSVSRGVSSSMRPSDAGGRGGGGGGGAGARPPGGYMAAVLARQQHNQQQPVQGGGGGSVWQPSTSMAGPAVSDGSADSFAKIVRGRRRGGGGGGGTRKGKFSSKTFRQW